MAYLERHYPPDERRNNELFTLYVSNLPQELNKDGIAQIFQAFGEIRLMSPTNAKWAFVGYKSYKEAEHAIRALNDRSPLFLKVAFQQKKTEQNAEPVGPSQEAKDFRYSETVVPNPHYRTVIPAMIGAQLPHCGNYNQESDVNSVYPSDMDHNTYNPFESVGRYAETSAMWSRGCMNVDDYGKRYVSLGRGFTRYHIPEPPRNLEQQIGRVFERRRAGLYEFGEDRLRSKVGRCQLCSRMTALYCELCAAFYCSRECQLGDWPRHRLECRTIPSLVGGLEVATLSRSSSDDQLHVPRKPGGRDLHALGTLRRPKTMPKHAGSPIPLEQTGTDLNCASRNEEIQRQVAMKDKPEPPIIDLTSPNTPDKNSRPNFKYDEEMQKGVNSPYNNRNETFQQPQNRQYDENSNDRSKPTARSQDNFKSQQNSFRNNERNGRENARMFNKSESIKSGKGRYNSNSSLKDVQSKTGSSEGLSDKTKKNFVQMDEDLLFARPQPSVENQNSHKTPSPQSSQIVKQIEPIENLFSKTIFTDVAVVFSMPDGTFWVHRKIDLIKIAELMEKLHNQSQGYPAATELVIGETYAVKYNNYWHRATVVSKNPLIIFYLDFGNEEPPQSEEFRLLNDFPIYPPYAIRMRQSAATNVQNITEDCELAVKMISIDKNGIVEVLVDSKPNDAPPALLETPKIAPAVVETPIARVEPPAAEKQTLKAAHTSPSTSQPAPPVSSDLQAAAPISSSSKVAEVKIAASEEKMVNKPKIKLPNAIEILEVNATGFIQVYMALDNNSYAVCALNTSLSEEYRLIYEELTETCAAMNQPTNFKPQIGDFVSGKRDDFWLRGYVFSLGPPIRLMLVDEARVSPVESVLPMPAKYEKICTFGSICIIETPGFTLNVDDAVGFTVTSVETVANEKIVKAVLTSPEHLNDVKVTLKNWSPTPEQKGIGFAELKPNSEVCITAYSNERIMFVRSLDEESQERTHRIIQDVAKWAQKAPKLDGPPAIGQLVIAKFTDGNFYRAIVTKIQNEKIGVSYVDYGNRDFTTIDELRVLSDELKQEKSCAAKIVLKDVKTDVPPTQEVHKYLNLLVGKEQSLFCTFEGIPSKDGVILTTATGECVNLKVNEYLTPAWQREDPSKNTKCFDIAQLEYAKLGEVGETRQALVLYGSELPFKYFMCPYDTEHIVHVTQIMPQMLDEYCKSTDKHYIPRATELCLAVYQGGWYRGLCLKPSSTPTQAEIHFIDFGNTELVNHVDIREMTKDFMSPAALACMCEIKNPGFELVNDEVPPNIKTRLDALIPLNDLVHVKILKILDDGEYVLEVPHVRQKLVEEGLIK